MLYLSEADESMEVVDRWVLQVPEVVSNFELP